MKTSKLWWLAFVLTLTFYSLGSLAQDQDDNDQNDQQDPPTRVARLNYSSGSVSFQPGGEGDWVTAVSNRPLTTGDNLWADKDSRAELHVGSTGIRMDSETSVSFLDLDDHTLQLRLSLGAIELRVRHLDDGDLLEVDTPNLAFTIQRSGEYRIDVNGDGNQTITTVWQGRAEATGGGYSYNVVAGQRATFTGTDDLDHEISQIPQRDDFDQWAQERDRQEDDNEGANYVSPEMTGSEDLDDYGRWHYVAGYGPVWTPSRVASDWAPYRYGHWVWISPWGWTWVEDEPWGFAPFHYGRWAFVESSWCWVPGPVVVRPVYAPALVAFVGGGGFHVSVGVGEGVAWFPLGPGEVYVPPYRVSRVYVNNVNITNTRVNVTQVTNVYNDYRVRNVNRTVYVNQRNPGAMTAVSRDTFINARPVGRNLAPVNTRELSAAPVSHMAPVQPVRSSVFGAGVPARFHPPAAVENRRVIATRNPSPPRAPFEQQRQAPNVRTETPRMPVPAESGRAGQPTAFPRPNEPMRPNEPVRPNEPARSSEPAYNNRPNAPGRDNIPPRPNEPAQASRPSEAQRPEVPRPGQSNAPRPYQGPASSSYSRPEHPLVRPAPPVQSRPQIDQNEANKFHTWQQQRPAPPPRENPRQQQSRPPQSHAQPNRQEDHKK